MAINQFPDYHIRSGRIFETAQILIIMVLLLISDLTTNMINDHLIVLLLSTRFVNKVAKDKNGNH